MSSSDRARLDAFNSASAKKHTLESILYDTFIMLSNYFKQQLFDLSQKLWEAKVHNWGERVG